MTAALYDVAVIGGGPAGCSAAIRLAQAGARVVLCEARTYPHDKVCGEFMSPECVDLLARLGLPDALPALGAVPIHTVRLAAVGGATWATRLPAPAWGLSRRSLDAALAERAAAAGVDLRAGATVARVSGALGAEFALTVAAGGEETVLHARAVIAGHGKRSSLDRAMGRGFLRQRQPYLALKAHYHGPRLPEAGMSGRDSLRSVPAPSWPPRRSLELRLFPGGYCGVTEIENGATNVCLLVREGAFQAAAGAGPGAASRFIAWLREQDAWLDTWLGRATPVHERWLSIAQVPFMAKDLVHDDVLMAGDAAGLVAPLAGDGIAMALAGGSLAADFVQAYLIGRLSAAGLRQGYAAAWRREFGPRLRLGRVLQPLLMQPRLAGLGLRLVRLAPGLGRALLHGTRDLGPLANTDPVGVELRP